MVTKKVNMKAAVIRKWGNAEVFKIEEVSQPTPGPDQVLVKIFACSINPVDWKHRKGKHQYLLGAPFPIILGYDICGEVIEAGSEIKHLNEGDIVFGDLDNKYGGGLAEYALGTEQCFALKPTNVSMEQSAAVSLAGLTALQALRDKAQLFKNQTVVINGASGGVGHMAVQIAKILQAKVIAVASGKNTSFLEQFSPDDIVDYTQQDILKIPLKADVFFDVIGNYSFLKTRHLLKPHGTYISTLPRPKILFHKLLQPFTRGEKVKTLLRKHSSSDLALLGKWMETGKLRIHIDRSFPLDKIAEAHAHSELGRTVGKSIIVIATHEKETKK
jgi:NADPH:quinone reductase-like Zn-dependent oxidoreductase